MSEERIRSCIQRGIEHMPGLMELFMQGRMPRQLHLGPLSRQLLKDLKELVLIRHPVPMTYHVYAPQSFIYEAL